jgi:hypothetical protein
VKPRHPPDESLWALGRGALESASLESHVAQCRPCDAEVALARLVVRARVAEKTPCPCAEDLVLMSEGMLEAASAAVSHVMGCAACARELESLERARGPAPLRERATAAAGRVISALEGGRQALERALMNLAAMEMPPSLVLVTRSGQAPVRPEFLRGMEAYRRGDLVAARRDLEGAMAQGESAPELRFFLAAVMRRLGKAAAAVALLEEVVAQRPRVAEYHWHLAQALLANGQGAEAVPCLERVARLPGPRRTAARAQARQVAKLLESA